MNEDKAQEARYREAEASLGDYLARLDSDREVSFDSWCADRPNIASELRRLYGEVREFQQTVGADQLANNAASVPGESDSSVTSEPVFFAQHVSGEDLLARLRRPQTGTSGYAVLDLIGRGGMGEVFAARDRLLNRELAMKVIRSQRSGSQEHVARFLEEAQVMSQLDHPGIVPLHELGLDEKGQPFFTMKRVRGRTLSEVFELVRKGRDGWSVTRALGVLQRVCDAVAYAHERGVVHRDLKPSNVMIGRHGEVFVMDWGLARVFGGSNERHVLSPTNEDSDLSDSAGSVKTARSAVRGVTPDASEYTRVGQALGTPQFMSPEQAAGRWQDVDSRSDVYAIGAMLYDLLAGGPPYIQRDEQPSANELQLRVIAGPPEALHRHAPSAPPELVAICDRAMSRDPDKRYSNTIALAADLRAYLEQRVVGAYETGAWAETKKWMQRNKSLAASLAAAVVLLVAGLTASLVFKSRAEEQAGVATLRAADLEVATQAAQRNESVAILKAAEVLSLSAIQDLKELVEEADSLWPADPGMIPRYERWLERARILIEGQPADPAHAIKGTVSLAQHKRKLAEIQARALPRTNAEVQHDREAHPRFVEWTAKVAELTWRSRMLGLETWPSEGDLEVLLIKEPLPTDAQGLNNLAWPQVDPDRPIYGQEVRALLLARRAVAAASALEKAGMRDTLAWGLFRVGRFDEALATEKQALEDAGPEKRTEYEADVKKLEKAIAGWKGEAAQTRRQKERESLRLAVEELESELNSRRTWSFQDREDRWWSVQLSKLVADLEALQDPKSGLYSSGIAPQGWGVRKRYEFATGIMKQSIEGVEAQQRWSEAIEAIAKNEKYRGARWPSGDRFVPQLGLVPIGADPMSGLWEFAHLQTGEETQRGPDGKLVVTEKSGLVFVLIPSGKFWMGAQKTDPKGPNFDLLAQPKESPVHEVELSAYFLSKYEMTQGQWMRMAGRNPSKYSPPWKIDDHRYDLRHPVEQVSWLDCMLMMEHLGLALPSEAQWENGCRAGSATPWWTGMSYESLRGQANIADQTYVREGGPATHIAAWPDLNDGWASHAPVGTFASNPWGLHEVHGNVWEWCQDSFTQSIYRSGSRKDPVSLPPASSTRISRGGSFGVAVAFARSAARDDGTPEQRYLDIGVRPAKSCSPSSMTASRARDVK